MLLREARESCGAPSNTDGHSQQDGQHRDHPQGRPQPPHPIAQGEPDTAEEADSEQPQARQNGRDRAEDSDLDRRVGHEGAHHQAGRSETRERTQEEEAYRFEAGHD
jgi:hypothetical protein